MTAAGLPNPSPDQWDEFVRDVEGWIGNKKSYLDALDRRVAEKSGKWPPLTDDDVRRLMAENPWIVPMVAKHRPDLVRPAVPMNGREKKAAPSYGSSTTKRGRRTKAAMEEIRATLHRITQRDQPTNVRGVYYQAASVEQVIAKIEPEYRTVSRLLSEMRRSGDIPYGWITDNTRWVRHATRYGSLHDALKDAARTYRRSLWDRVPAYVEVWLEKEALAGVFYPVTNKWDVPLYVTRGYASLSYLHAAGESIRGREYPTYIYYFGDWDPSGVNIGQTIERELRGFSDGAEIVFERVGVTPELIRAWHLPTRPTKTRDSRASRFEGESVELDAIAAPKLRALCEARIVHHLDPDEIARIEIAEAAERETLQSFVEKWPGGAA